MISSGRILCGVSKCPYSLISEILTGTNKYNKCSAFCSSALRLSSAVHIPETPSQDEPNRIRQYKFKTAEPQVVNLGSCPEKDLNFSHIDPDTFGNLGGKRNVIEEAAEDEGDMEEEKYLEQPPSKGQRLRPKEYANIIKEFFSQKKVADAIDVLETRMIKEDRVKPDNYIYNIIISECGRLGYTKKAFQLYNQMKKRDLKVTGATYTALFNACANSPWPQDGLKRAKHLRELIIEKAYEPNAHNYHAMIKAFGRCGDLSTAFSLVDEMAEKKITISNETFNFLLHTCISDNEAGFRHALLVWRKMINKRVKPDIYTFNLLLRCIRDCGLGDVDVTRDTFHKIIEESQNRIPSRKAKKRPLLEAGESTMLTLNPSEEVEAENTNDSDSCDVTKETSLKKNNLEQPSSDEIVDPVSPILENRPNLLALQPHLGNIIALTEITKAEDRLLLVGGYSGFLEQMRKHAVQPDIKTFTQLLHNIPSTRAAEQALLAAMQKEGVQADIDFYNMVIKKRSMRFDYKSARDVLKKIHFAKLHPDIVTFGVLALGCQTKDEAQWLISDMRNAGFRMNAEILGAMLRQGCCRWNFDYVMAIMETAIEEDVLPNEQFLQHLENFHKGCLKKIKYKDTNVPGIPQGAGRNYFKSNFQKFCTRYNAWLKEIEPENVGHPWEQFQKKTQNNKDVTKENSEQKRNTIRSRSRSRN